MGRVSGKVAIVTGGASGIGAATSKLLAREGAKVMVSDLQAIQVEAVAAAIRAGGADAVSVVHDVTSEKDWETAISNAMDTFGRVDIVVNNAGISLPNGNVEAQSLDAWRRIMAVNLEGTFLGTKHGIAAMRRSGRGGSIINFSSILGIASSATASAYSASKGGVRLFTKSAALHCAKSGYRIRVNSIHPGYIWTPMLEEALHAAGELATERKRVEAATPLGHVGEVDDIAYGVLYLGSDESKFMTGAELVIDGGYLAQ